MRQQQQGCLPLPSALPSGADAPLCSTRPSLGSSVAAPGATPGSGRPAAWE